MSFGLSDWKRLYGRAITMNRAEIVDRVRQRTNARIDFLRYKAGADFSVPFDFSPGGASAQFFFSPESVPGLCARLRRQFPETVDLIVKSAEQICLHRFDLLGYKDLDYGEEIDWHCDRVHGIRAPRKPWYRLKYLEFSEVGDSKVTWELNRHQHLVTLAKAFRLTKNPKYAEELFRQWHHWHAENPYPIGINWASSLEVAFRSISWLWVYFLLADSPVLPSGFRTDWLRSLAVSGSHIERYLSTYFSPNTHLLGEAVALFFIGTLCPEIPASRQWQQKGWKIVQQEASRQVRADGLHFEQAIYYHVYALDFFLHTSVLASLNEIKVPLEYVRTVERMLDALALLAGGGAVPRFGDDDGGRLFDPARNEASHMLDPLATGAVLFSRGDFKAIVRGPREETLWLLGEPGLDEFESLSPSSFKADSKSFPESGLYIMSGGDTPGQLVIDAGPQGADTAGHGHADALSVVANCNGRSLLIDSGTSEYVGNERWRDRFRGTGAHNTLMIAGQDQAELRGPFGWQRLPNVQAEGWIVGKSFDLFVASHDGYTRFPSPAVHRRFVFSLRSGFWLIRDVITGSGIHQLDLFWHLAPELQLDPIQPDYFADEHGGIQIVTAQGNDWARTVERQPHAPVYGRRETHVALHFAAEKRLPAEFVTVLQPVRKGEYLERVLSLVPSPEADSAMGYRYESGDAEHLMIFGRGRPWSVGGWSSDAEFLYANTSQSGRLLICCRATYADWNGRRMITATQPVLRVEVFGSDEPELVSPNPEAVSIDHEAWRLFTDLNPQIALKVT
jgi:hypothetical protein